MVARPNLQELHEINKYPTLPFDNLKVHIEYYLTLLRWRSPLQEKSRPLISNCTFLRRMEALPIIY